MNKFAQHVNTSKIAFLLLKWQVSIQIHLTQLPCIVRSTAQCRESHFLWHDLRPSLWGDEGFQVQNRSLHQDMYHSCWEVAERKKAEEHDRLKQTDVDRVAKLSAVNTIVWSTHVPRHCNWESTGRHCTKEGGPKTAVAEEGGWSSGYPRVSQDFFFLTDAIRTHLAPSKIRQWLPCRTQWRADQSWRCSSTRRPTADAPDTLQTSTCWAASKLSTKVRLPRYLCKKEIGFGDSVRTQEKSCCNNASRAYLPPEHSQTCMTSLTRAHHPAQRNGPQEVT